MKTSDIAAICLLGVVSCQPETRLDEATDAPPPTAAETPAALKPDVAKPETFIGSPLETAEAACEAAGVPHRVVERDGISLPGTMDHRPERLNFTVKDGIVVAVRNG